MEKEIKTKFNIGDTVYFIDKNGDFIRRSYVDSIFINIYGEDYKHTGILPICGTRTEHYPIIVHYEVSNITDGFYGDRKEKYPNSFHGVFLENQLFSTKEELLSHLSKTEVNC